MSVLREAFAQAISDGATAEEAFALSGMTRSSDFPAAGYYVYGLINPLSGRIFYIGKGKDKRHSRHAAECKAGRVLNARKFATISEIHAAGLSVQAVCLHECETEANAYRVERELISLVGFSLLTNVTPGTRTAEEIAAERARFLLSRIKPFARWMRERSSEHDAGSYWFVMERLRSLAYPI